MPPLSRNIGLAAWCSIGLLSGVAWGQSIPFPPSPSEPGKGVLSQEAKAEKLGQLLWTGEFIDPALLKNAEARDKFQGAIDVWVARGREQEPSREQFNEFFTELNQGRSRSRRAGSLGAAVPGRESGQSRPASSGLYQGSRFTAWADELLPRASSPGKDLPANPPGPKSGEANEALADRLADVLLTSGLVRPGISGNATQRARFQGGIQVWAALQEDDPAHKEAVKNLDALLKDVKRKQALLAFLLPEADGKLAERGPDSMKPYDGVGPLKPWADQLLRNAIAYDKAGDDLRLLGAGKVPPEAFEKAFHKALAGMGKLTGGSGDPAQSPWAAGVSKGLPGPVSQAASAGPEGAPGRSLARLLTTGHGPGIFIDAPLGLSASQASDLGDWANQKSKDPVEKKKLEALEAKLNNEKLSRDLSKELAKDNPQFKYRGGPIGPWAEKLLNGDSPKIGELASENPTPQTHAINTPSDLNRTDLPGLFGDFADGRGKGPQGEFAGYSSLPLDPATKKLFDSWDDPKKGAAAAPPDQSQPDRRGARAPPKPDGSLSPQAFRRVGIGMLMAGAALAGGGALMLLPPGTSRPHSPGGIRSTTTPSGHHRLAGTNGGHRPERHSVSPHPKPAHRPEHRAEPEHRPAHRAHPQEPPQPAPKQAPAPHHPARSGSWRAISKEEQALIDQWNSSPERAEGRASLEEWLDQRQSHSGVDVNVLKSKLLRDA